MNALEKAQLRIELKDRIPENPERGELYHLAWASPKFKRMKVTLISIRNNKVIVRTSKGKPIVTNKSDLRNLENIAIKNAKERIKQKNNRKQLNFNR